MYKAFVVLLTIFCIAGIGCFEQGEKPAQPISMQALKAGPQLVKIPVKNASVADSLIKLGVDVIVVEDDYIIARVEHQQAAGIQAMALSMKKPEEIELIQRLIKVVMKEKADLQTLADTGIDIWEVKSDTVTAQAFDKHIREIKALGFDLTIVEKDIRNLVEK